MIAAAVSTAAVPACGQAALPATPYSNWQQATPAARDTSPDAVTLIAPSQAASHTPQALEECEVIAKIDGQIVQACEIMWQVNQIIEDNRDKIQPGDEHQVREMLMLQRLGGVVDTKLLYAEFLRNVPHENLDTIYKQLDKPFEEIQIPQLMKRFKAESRADLEMKLTTLNTSVRDMRNMFREQALAGEWLRTKVKVNEEVTHDDMLNYYHTHLADYEYPTQARWEELMVRRNRFGSRREAIEEICRMGNAAYNQAVAKNAHGPIFAEIAKAKSHGYTAKDGGIHDWTTQGALKSAEIDRELFTLAVGQMSELIESDEGFYIVRVLERKEAGRTPFTEVQTKITEAIKRERFTEAQVAYLDKLRRNARIWTVYTGETSYERLAKPLGAPTRR